MKQRKQQVNEKATIFAVKEQLEFLSSHIWMMRKEGEGMVEDSISLMDYLPYTKSVIHVQAQASYDSSSRVIQAMQRQEQELEYRRRKYQAGIRRMKILLAAIQALPQKEADCMHGRYVQHLSYEEISRALGISQSSVGRLIRQGCLHLAMLLHLEVYHGEESALKEVISA